jgi:hypothetical protein
MSRADISQSVETLGKDPRADQLKQRVFNCFIGHPTEVRKGGLISERLDLKRDDHQSIFLLAVRRRLEAVKTETSSEQHPLLEKYFQEAWKLLLA